MVNSEKHLGFRKLPALIVVATIALTTASCSLVQSGSQASQSVGSISSSISTISDSLLSVSGSLGSLSGGAEVRNEDYRAAVRHLTLLHLRENLSADHYLRNLGELSLQHGIVAWDEQLVTYKAIGEAFAHQSIGDTKFRHFLQGLPEPMAEPIRRGYEEHHRTSGNEPSFELQPIRHSSI